MLTHYDQLILTSNGDRVTYHEIREEVREIVRGSGIKNGICIIKSPHTTCSVFFEEFMHDIDYRGYESLQVDLNKVMDDIVPVQMTETDYVYPRPLHTDFLREIDEENFPENRYEILNADAHLKATIIGNGITVIIKDGELLTGPFGYIYFVDWDHNRQRDRECKIQIIGE